MQRYIIRRLLLTIPTLLGVTLVVFLMVRAVPGDVSDQLLGEFGTNREAREAILEEYGLDGGVVQQYVKYLGEVLTMDLGESVLSGRTVQSELANRLPVTLELGILAILFSLIISIPIGVISAIRQDTAADYVGRSVAIGALAAPNFWIAIVIITLAARWDPLGFDLSWAVPPATYTEFQDDPIKNLKFMFMPSLLLGAGLSGSVMRFTRSAMLEVLRQDYIRTAWSKGLRERVIIVNHAMKNALIPVVTVVGLQLPILVGGSVIIESVYSIPGIGRYYILAINTLDYPVIQSIVLITALMVIFANLAVDLLYSVLDPRIRYA